MIILDWREVTQSVKDYVDNSISQYGGATTASQLTFDNSTNGFTANDTQAAIEELDSKKVVKATGYSLIQDATKQTYDAHLSNNTDAHGFLVTIRDSVATEGNTLAKLYALFSNYTPNTGLTTYIYSSVFNALSATNAEVVNGDTLTQVINKIIGKVVTKQDSLGFTAENAANKSTSVTTNQASDTKYPSVKSVYDWATGLFLASASFSDTGVTSKVLTGFSSGAGTVSATDTVLQAINKLVGNLATKATLSAAQTFSGAQCCSVTALTSTSASIAIDFSANNQFSHTLTENTTLANPSNVVVGQSGCICLTQHASSPKTLAYGSYYKFAGGTVPTLTATNSASDTLYYNVRSSTFIECSLVKGFA